MGAKSVRAFSDPKYDYYKLLVPFGTLEPGAIFYYDREDALFGSLSEGCVKLCWTADGDCYGGINGGAIVLPASYRNVETLFKRCSSGRNKIDAMNLLRAGRYNVILFDDGTFVID